jgi:hypothetical protein
MKKDIIRFMNLIKETLIGIMTTGYVNKLKRILFEHHKKIVVSIMMESPVLQIISRSDLQTHNYLADDECIIIEMIRLGVSLDEE